MERARQWDPARRHRAKQGLTMPHLAPDRQFTLIHVGKCGGGSVLAALRATGYRVEHVHL